MKKIKITVSAAVLILLCQFVLAQSQNNELKQHAKRLSDERSTIKKKQREKEELMLKERVFKRELNNLNTAIKGAERKLERLSLDIKNAEKHLSTALSEYNKSYEKQTGWSQAMLDEMDYYNKMTFLISYEDDPVEYKIRRAALQYKKDNFDKEAKAVDSSTAEMNKWENAKKKLLALRAEENKTTNERKKLILEKNNLLKSTANKRISVEEEIKSHNESAKALQALINKLSEAEKKKRQAEALSAAEQDKKQAKPAASPAAKTQRKKSLPWPVEGKVVLKFGKSKHPELDTYLISNGIKIKAADFAQVKSSDYGTVIFTGEFRSYGKVVIIDHRNSSFTVYGQLDQILVKEDHRVLKGTVLGKLGKGEDSVLYFEVRQNNNPDDPLLWLEKGK